MRSRLLFTSLVAAMLAATAPAAAAPHLTQIASFAAPVYLTAPPGDPHRLFVVEQGGRIREIRDGQPLASPFLDIHGDVYTGGGAEQGLLSMAFAPDYATSGRFYVYYTAPRPGDSTGSVITVKEFTRAPGNPDAADPASGRVIFTVDHPAEDNHNGGQLQFGPDGLLYAGTGDGGGGNDQRSPPGTNNNAQNLSSNLGKLLRVNPLAGGPPQIYAYGLRNPWRYSFDRQTGDLIIADVGQGAQEEVDFSPAGDAPGRNYGWPCWEGTRSNTEANPPCSAPGSIFPVFTRATHAGGGCAIVGGYVVRDPALAGLVGRYLYGDNCSTPIHSVLLSASGSSGDAPTGMSVSALTSFGEDSCGHVYATSGNGPVYRIDGDAFAPCSEPTGSGAGGGGGDGQAPRVMMSARRRQRLLRQKGLKAAVACSELCGATVNGRVRIAHSKRVYSLRPVTVQLGANKRRKVVLKLSRHGLRAVKTAQRRHRKVSARLIAVGRDPAGNAALADRLVKAKL